MILHNEGQVINICSVAALKGYPSGGSYAISKHALIRFFKKFKRRSEGKEH